MPLINLSLEHGRTRGEARASLQNALNEVRQKIGPMIHRVEWSGDADRVRLDGSGFWVEMRVDDQFVHATGDMPMLAGLLGGPLAGGLKKILEHNFPKKLT
jgi:hypothetical protein